MIFGKCWFVASADLARSMVGQLISICWTADIFLLLAAWIFLGGTPHKKAIKTTKPNKNIPTT